MRAPYPLPLSFTLSKAFPLEVIKFESESETKPETRARFSKRVHQSGREISMSVTRL